MERRERERLKRECALWLKAAVKTKKICKKIAEMNGCELGIIKMQFKAAHEKRIKSAIFARVKP